jgi:hypothetical protein
MGVVASPPDAQPLRFDVRAGIRLKRRNNNLYIKIAAALRLPQLHQSKQNCVKAAQHSTGAHTKTFDEEAPSLTTCANWSLRAEYSSEHSEFLGTFRRPPRKANSANREDAVLGLKYLLLQSWNGTFLSVAATVRRMYFGRLVCRLTWEIDLQNLTRVPRFGESIDHQKSEIQTEVLAFELTAIEWTDNGTQILAFELTDHEMDRQ